MTILNEKNRDSNTSNIGSGLELSKLYNFLQCTLYRRMVLNSSFNLAPELHKY